MHQLEAIIMKSVIVVCTLIASVYSQVVGPSGITSPDGNHVQFSHDFANNIVLRGPAGIVTRTGNNLHFTHGQVQAQGTLPQYVPAATHSTGNLVGASGIVTSTGQLIQLTHKQARSHVLSGPSGIVFADGNNVQLSRRKRAAIGAADTTCVVGHSGVSCPHGNYQLPLGVSVVNIGPSGMVLTDGSFFSFP